MHRGIRCISLTMILLLFSAFGIIAQVQFQVPIHIQGVDPAVDTATVWIGISGDGPGGSILDNTYGPDVGPEYGPYGMWREQLAPPPPPSCPWFVTFMEVPGRSGCIPSTGMFPYDFRGYTLPIQVDTFAIQIKGGHVENGPLTISWPPNIGDYANGWELKKKVGPNWITIVTDMTTTTSCFDPNSAYASKLDYLLIKSCAMAPSPGPNFIVTPLNLNFGVVFIGDSAWQVLRVINNGTDNDLIIDSIYSDQPQFTVNPSAFPILVPHNNEYVDITVKFKPDTSGSFSGNVIFIHDGVNVTSPTSVPVQGEGLIQGGIIDFASSSVSVLDNSCAAGGFYVDTIQLKSYTGTPLKALQFTLVSNGKVIMHPLQKAGPFNTENWMLATNVIRGPELPDGSSVDEIHTILYGQPGAEQGPITEPIDVLTIAYDVVNIYDDSDSTSFDLIDIIGMTNVASNANLNETAHQAINITNRTYKGDINLDDRVDIFDLLYIIDHITGKNLLTDTAFTRADIAPWGTTPGDGVVDVLDFVLTQVCILTDQYPDGNPTMSFAAQVEDPAGSSADVEVQFCISNNEIEIIVENTVAIRGLQADLINVDSALTNNSDTSLTGIASNLKDDVLSIVVKQSEDLQPGKHSVGTIPVTVGVPANVRIRKLIVAGSDLQEITNISAEIIIKHPTGVSSEEEGVLPSEYSLGQNYPNPFNPETNILVSVPQTSDVNVTVYNLLGQEIKILYAGRMERGIHPLRWYGKDQNGRAVSTGIYFYRMQAGSFVETKKMLLIK